MSGYKYDYAIVGRWRNKDAINTLKDALRRAGKKVYCFTDNEYDSDGIKFERHDNANVEVMMATTEKLTDWQTNPTFRKIFETDLQGVRDAEALILVFPAGLSAHMELGLAYGMGKKCYALGAPEKPETLYLMIDTAFPDTNMLVKELA